jgi:CheY-like chemotaxis protein
MATRLLLIDDDRDDRELFCEAVEAIGEEIVCYSEPNGRRAIEKLDSKKIESPDVIFLDVNMPLMDGWECLRILKSNEAFKHIPIIMFSTSSQTEEVEKAQQLGAISFIKKPTDFKSFKKSLEIIINHLMAGSLQPPQVSSPLLIISFP